MINKEEFLEKSKETIGNILINIENLQSLDLNSLERDKTVLIIVDMVNGFAKEGILSSPRINNLIPEIVRIAKICSDLKIKIINFADTHVEDSVEFESYPTHCLRDTNECEIVDELKVFHSDIYEKNSTNGFLEPNFISWLGDNSIKNFIIVGDCTDICIQQLALSIKAFFNRFNLVSQVIVPINAVDTYDLVDHNGDLMNLIALYNMSINGIKLVKSIEEKA